MRDAAAYQATNPAGDRTNRCLWFIRLFTPKTDGAVHDAVGMAFTGMEIMAPVVVLADVYLDP